jgi:TolB-like protein/DNA-binding winged helix-turn-helix (wHTH) protein/cytochrome c-type biogenesis protein CcmH/NrfG
MEAIAAPEISLFGEFRFDRKAGGLFRRDDGGAFRPVRIGSRALDVLAVLVERPSDLVTKAEIIAIVWPGTVIEDSNLTIQISALRRVLDVGQAGCSCIQTVSGRGYRFVTAVTRVEPAAPLAIITAETEQPRGSTPAGGLGGLPTIGISRALRWPWLSACIIAGVLVFVAAVAAWNWHSAWFGPPIPHLSIAVLPFANLSNDPEQQYFADGITEDLTTDLSRIRDSFVISRNTAFTYKDKPVNAKQIGQELGVRYVLEGSVQRSGQQVSVNAQLIDAETDAHVWAERFERDIGDLFALQNEITSRIAIALNLALLGAEGARTTGNPDAQDYILRGRAALSKPQTPDNYTETIGLFERALVLDPRSVEAQSDLVIALSQRMLDLMTDTVAADTARAEALVERALATSPSSPIAHYAKGQLLRAQNRYPEAIPEFETALASNRNWVAAIANLGQSKFYAGFLSEMIPAQEQAIRLSPRDPYIGNFYARIGVAHLLQSQTEEAILWLEKARSANPALRFVHGFLASAYALKGDSERATAELAEARRLGPKGYSSIARSRSGLPGVPPVRDLWENTYLAGLRKIGVPEE